MREIVLRQHVNSYIEHWKKAVKALGDPSKCHEVNDWVGDLRHFAKLIHDDCVAFQNDGGKVTSIHDKNDVWSRQRIDDAFDKRMAKIIQLDNENKEVARRHSILLG